jgi:hypothetical protein
MTRRGFLAALSAAGAAGAVAGAGGMLGAYPFLFPPAPGADAPPADAAGRPLPARARFAFDETAPGRDPIHWANGMGAVHGGAGRFVLRLAEDFEAGPGPNFWLYLNTRAVGDERDFVADAGRVKLAPLRAFVGAQNYELPPGLDPLAFHTATVWCETFGVYIGSGALAPA